jgi:AraC family transcriptional activator of tynA and feaB
VSMAAAVSNEMVEDFSTSHLPWRLDVSRGSVLEHRTVHMGESWAVDCRLGGMAGRRDAPQIRRTDGEYVAVLLVRHGTETFTQHGRRAQVGAGTAVIWDGVRPGECVSGQDLVKTTFFMPRDLCRDTMPHLDAIVARTVPDSPSLRLLFSWLQTSTSTEDLDGTAAATAGHVAIDLLTSAIGASSNVVLDTRTIRLMEIRAFIDAHFGDSELTVDTIASANAVSTRYLHLLFQETGESCRQYLMRRRQEAAHQLLMSATGLSITEVAHRCGFDTPSSFSRAYRAAFGLSPRASRNARRQT